MHPDIKARLSVLENGMANCDMVCNEISFISKQLTKDDGELNVKVLKKAMDKFKSDVIYRIE